MRRAKAYIAEMAFFRDDPTIRTTVRWYPCAPTAKDLPFGHIFWSQRWERKEYPEMPIGERFNPYKRCWPIRHPELKGDHFCGTLEQWQNGCLTTDPIPPINPDTGHKNCCPAAIWKFGGDADGGPFNTPCGNDLPPIVYVKMQYFTGTYAGEEYFWKFVWAGGFYQCVTDFQWSVPHDLGYVGPAFDNANKWRIRPVDNVPFPYVEYYIPGWPVGPFIGDAPCHLWPAPTYYTNFSDNRTPRGFIIPWYRYFGESAGIFTGGDADGGQFYPTQPYSTTLVGGDADGGDSADLGLVQAQGGDADGGLIQFIQAHAHAGGDADGGEGQNPLVLDHAGGDAEGGAMPVPNDYYFLPAGGDADGGDQVDLIPDLETVAGGDADGGYDAES